MKVEAIDERSPYLIEVKALGRKNASTLGFLPEGAFDEHARKRQILVALSDDNQCLGYVLYRIANRTAKVVHLCIATVNRQSGIARLLINELKRETKDLIGISLRCRKDYEANKIWPKFGFVNYGEKPGRGKDASTLVTWYINNGHPTLLDLCEPEATDKLDVVVDANVFFDFFDELRSGHAESSALLADWLDESIHIWVVDEIYNDIGRGIDDEIQRLSRERASQYLRTGYKSEEVESQCFTLEKSWPKLRSSLSERDESDLRHVAKTICTNASFFITRDEELIEALGETVFRQTGVRILRPADFIKQIDEIRRERDYYPANLCGTEVERVFVKSGQDSELSALFHQGEPRPQFQNRFRGFLSNVKDFESHVIRDSVGNPVGLFVFDLRKSSRLRIPVLRTRKGNLERTIVRTMIALSINEAIVRQKYAVEILDGHIGTETETALGEAGFIGNEKGWIKFQFDCVLTKDEFTSRIQTFESESKQEAAFLRQMHEILTSATIPIEFYGEIERLCFPLKLLDSQIPSFIVPIKPGWARELFDSELAGQGLYATRADIALRREQVYYRSKVNSGGIRAPGRILWYVTDGKPRLTETRAIRAVSQIYEVEIDKPKLLYRRFKRLGIYEWKNVFELAKLDIENDVMAIRFGNTQLFSRSISLNEYAEILSQFSKNVQLQSPSEIPQLAFVEIYKKGTGRS